MTSVTILVLLTTHMPAPAAAAAGCSRSSALNTGHFNESRATGQVGTLAPLRKRSGKVCADEHAAIHLLMRALSFGIDDLAADSNATGVAFRTCETTKHAAIC